ncbi:MAG: transporter substrate-binding domain-containing protein [Pseudomonadota bacterium]
MKLLPFLRLACALCLALVATCAGAVDIIPLYVIYEGAPFAPDQPGSLSDKLATNLNEQAKGRYLFVPTALPRKRVEVLMDDPNWRGVVAWVNPEFFGDRSHTKYLWSAPLYTDSNLVLSRRGSPVDYKTPLSLRGLRVGTIDSFRHPDLEPLFAGGGSMRADVHARSQNMFKLRAGRIDAVLMQASAMAQLRRDHPDLEQWAHIARQPQAVYQRHLLVSNDLALYGLINHMLADMQREPAWKQLADM